MSTQSGNLISVIMPCYNAQNYIAAAIESVLAQTHQRLELIIINDGSTDASEKVIQEFSDHRIRYFYQNNSGQCIASNFGLKEANGDYIKFFDADDIMNEDHLAAQLERLSHHDDCIASCAWGRFYDGDVQSAKFVPETVWRDMPPLEWIKAALRQKYDMMGAWVWLIPRKIIDKAGGWDERLSLNNDFEFSMRLLMHADEILFAPEAKLYYRSGSATTLSQTNDRKKIEAALLSNELGCSYLLQKEDTEETRRLCANRYQRWLYGIYPEFPDLQQHLQYKIAEFGGSTIRFDGGRAFQTLSKVVGWRMASRIKTSMRRFGYKKLPF